MSLLTGLGFQFSSISYDDIPVDAMFGRILDVTLAAEESGYASIWVSDHIQQNWGGGDGPEYPMLEAYTLLGALASRTNRVALGAMVTPVTFRNPGLLAKMVTTVDVVSHGRAVLGMGAGWDVEEHGAYHIPYPVGAERWHRLEEAVQVCRALFSSETADFSGKYYALETAHSIPQPVQRRLPIVVGGSGESRTLPVVARQADACSLIGEPADLRRKIEILRNQCEAAHRDFSELTIMSAVNPPESHDELRALVEGQVNAGVEGVVLMARTSPDADMVAGWGRALQDVLG